MDTEFWLQPSHIKRLRFLRTARTSSPVFQYSHIPIPTLTLKWARLLRSHLYKLSPESDQVGGMKELCHLMKEKMRGSRELLLWLSMFIAIAESITHLMQSVSLQVEEAELLFWRCVCLFLHSYWAIRSLQQRILNLQTRMEHTITCLCTPARFLIQLVFCTENKAHAVWSAATTAPFCSPPRNLSVFCNSTVTL